MRDYDKMGIPRFDPKKQALTFFRVKGIDYRDLITADHAADLLVEWTKHITDWNKHALKLVEDVLAVKATPVMYVQKMDKLNG